MPELNDRAYFTDRAETERKAAEAATDPAVAKIHREMAANYSKQAGLTPEEPPLLHRVEG